MAFLLEPEYTIIQISDTHLMEHPEQAFVGMNPEQTFHGLIQHIVATHPKIDAILHTGDVAQEATTATYQRYLDYMHSLNIPFFQVAGNHDDLQIFPYHQTSRISYIELGNWVVILITSAVTGHTDGYIDEQQLAQLTEWLDQFKERDIILACHHNPIQMASFWLDQHRLKNPQQLLEIVLRYPQVKAIIHGHVHQDFSQVIEHLQILAVPSTSVQFKPLSQDFALDLEAAPGYRCLTLGKDGHLASQIYRVPALLPKINQLISGY
ncbi:metallophosphoesterase [Acinetobacter sp. MD2(2019)]|uniref:metallophosphoesterase n=1 Tax=Acinetobacter sp. MD2(2019) TaxID=2605273 RepID=UPI002D1F184E|nr:metallophosphoesterase [Acinetobacter sp. MD2(2019)]MEB3755029.1 metallophosphoesterase [Acinetobacter sp. MD2(2019)]